MSFQLDTLAQLLDRTRKSFRDKLKGTDAWVWPNNVYVTAKVVTGAVFEAIGFAAWIKKCIFVSSAPDMDTLKLHGNEYGMPPKPAYPASGTIMIVSAADCAVEVGAVVQRTDGVQYIAGAAAQITGGGTVKILATAATAGANTKAEDGTSLAIVSGISDPEAVVTVSGDIDGGADVEGPEEYRNRILFRKRYPPHGGAPSDYVLWAGEVIGVTRTYVERLWNGVGTVRVFVLMDDIYPNGIPPADAVQRVSDFIETVKPAGALVTYAAPVPVPVNITVSGLTPNTVDIQNAVVAALTEAFARLSRVSGNDIQIDGLPFLAYPTTFSRSWIWQAIANATGEQRHILLSPAADVALSAGQIATLGNITFAP